MFWNATSISTLSPYSFPVMSRVMAAAEGSFETFLSETKRTNGLLNTTTTPPAHHGVNLAKTWLLLQTLLSNLLQLSKQISQRDSQKLTTLGMQRQLTFFRLTLFLQEKWIRLPLRVNYSSFGDARFTTSRAFRCFLLQLLKLVQSRKMWDIELTCCCRMLPYHHASSCVSRSKTFSIHDRETLEVVVLKSSYFLRDWLYPLITISPTMLLWCSW